MPPSDAAMPMTAAAPSAPADRAPVRRARPGAFWFAGAALVALAVLAPILSLVLTALEGSGDLWPHLVAYVLPQALTDTALLLAGVGAIAVVIGTGTAWLVTAYDFRGRRVLSWALLLPLAVPTYIVAFAYLDILHPIGPVQAALKAVFGREAMRGFRLPELRSLGGCIFVIGFVLYPYVYLTARAMFAMQAASLIEAARTLGCGPVAAFFRIALPQARPAVAVGTSLALMETMNDIGASEFLGVQTLTVSIYATWVNRSNLPGAAQIALAALAVVVLLVGIERWARRQQRHAGPGQRARPVAPARLRGLKGAAAFAACAFPVAIGFAAPAAYLLSEAIKRLRFAGFGPDLMRETLTTFGVAAAATVLTVVLGLIVAHAARLSRLASRRGLATDLVLRAASLGYAVPGTVLAIGLMMLLAGLDRIIGAGASLVGSVDPGLIVSGSAAAVVYACVARFLAVSTGGIDAGYAKIPASFDHAARTLGRTAGGTLARIHLPLLRPATGAAALLVFVDCMKELPATLLLRPLNFETLATHLYGEAARGSYEDGAVAALAIVLFGLLPVIVLARLSGKPAA